MVHISPWEATLGLINGAAAALSPTSRLYLYGPYLREGIATAPGNQVFDRSLRDRDSHWGTGLRHDRNYASLGVPRSRRLRLGRQPRIGRFTADRAAIVSALLTRAFRDGPL